MRRSAEKDIIKLVKTFGQDEERDEDVEHLDFSLLRGSYVAPFDSETVELEFTKAPASKRDEPYGEEESRDKQNAARARFQKFYAPIIPLGCILYALTLGGGYVSGRFCECSDGPGAWGFAFPAVAILIQVCVLNHITILLSQTEVEGRPLLRLLKTLECADKYHVMALLSLVDTFSRWTRAQFVGYIAHCHAGVDKPFTEAFEGTGLWKQLVDYIGISGLSHLCFITGPILIQFGYMLWLRCKLQKELQDANERLPGEDMAVMDSVDDLAALFNWAMLGPAGKVMEMAALPLNLDSDEDVERLWDGMLTKTWTYLARDIPDGVLQMALQASFFSIVFAEVGLVVKGQLLLNIVLAGGPVLIDAFELIAMNRRITVVAGLVLLLGVVFFGGWRTVGAFVCESHLTGPVVMLKFGCIPPGVIDLGNWTSGELPG